VTRLDRVLGDPEAVSFGEETEGKSYCLLEVNDDGSIEVQQIPTRSALPHHRLGQRLGTSAPDELAGAIVRVRVRKRVRWTSRALRRDLEAAGVHEYR